MEFDKVIQDRFAVRSFKSDKLESEKIELILNAGRMAPTAKNLQPQKIYVVQSEEGLKKIDNVTPCRYGAPVCLLVCSDKDVAWSNGEYSSYEMDASIVATFMMLKATSIGIDNIWVRMFDREKVSQEFGLDNNIIPICIIPIGYRSDNCITSPNHNKRKDISEFVEYV